MHALDLPPADFERLLRLGRVAAGAHRAGHHAVAVTDVIPRAIAVLFQRRARAFGLRIDVVDSVGEACALLGVSPCWDEAGGPSRAAGGAAS